MLPLSGSGCDKPKQFNGWAAQKDTAAHVARQNMKKKNRGHVQFVGDCTAWLVSPLFFVILCFGKQQLSRQCDVAYSSLHMFLKVADQAIKHLNGTVSKGKG